MSEKIAPEKMQTTILIISDVVEVGQSLQCGLQQRGYGVVVAEMDVEILQHWADLPPDLIVIDLHTSNADGIELCRSIRGEATVPLLLFLPRQDEALILEGYRAGADECAANPISIPVFLAKIQAWLRRSQLVPAESLDSVSTGMFQLDPVHRQLTLADGTAIRLTNLESRLLYLLMCNHGRALESDQIISRVWGYYGGGDSVLLKNVIYRLRRKLEADPGQPEYILTEPGVGYRFIG